MCGPAAVNDETLHDGCTAQLSQWMTECGPCHWRDAACRRVSAAAPLYAELRAASDDQIAFNSKSAATSSAINDSQLSSLKYYIHFTLSYIWRIIHPEGSSKIYYNQFVKCLEDLIPDYTTWRPWVPMTKRSNYLLFVTQNDITHMCQVKRRPTNAARTVPKGKVHFHLLQVLAANDSSPSNKIIRHYQRVYKLCATQRMSQVIACQQSTSLLSGCANRLLRNGSNNEMLKTAYCIYWKMRM